MNADDRDRKMNRYLQTTSIRARDENESQEAVYPTAGIFSNLGLMTAVFLLVAALGVLHAMTVTPLYEASAVLQIKRNSVAAAEPQQDTPATTEMEILRSRAILSRVVQRLQLDIVVEPKTLPVIGAILDRDLRTDTDPAAAEASAGTERLRVALFDVPGALMKQPFVLTMVSGGRYALTQKETGIGIGGMVGQTLNAATRYGNIRVLVSQSRARPGAQFTVRRLPVYQAVERLQHSLVVAENGKQSNVIRVALQGSNPELLSRILNEIGTEYMRQHVAEKSDDASKVMSLYDRQLEESQQRLRQLDNRYDQVLRRYGTADLGEESRSLSQQAVGLQTKLADAEQKRLELSSRFLDQHPSMEAVNRQIADLQRSLAQVEGRRRSIAAAERELLSVTRDKQISSDINASLLTGRRKIEGLMPSEHGDVRMLDRAEVPVQALTMGFPTMVTLSCLAAAVLAVIASIIRNAFRERSRVRILQQRKARFRLISMSRTEEPKSV
jgi:tyrosine-protein kinase Etk/Wzc